MTSATVAKTAAKTTQSQAKPEKIRRDHKVNWWLTAAVAVLSLTVLVPLYFAGHRVEDSERGWYVQLADHMGMA